MSIYSDVLNALNIASVGGKSVSITPSITTSAGAYTSGDVVGGAIQLKDVFRKNNGTSILKSIHVKDNANQSAPFTILLFNSAPTNATTTDNSAFAYGSTSFPSQVARFNVANADYETIDSKSNADIDTFAKVLQANGSSNDLWMVIITTGTPTYAANATTLYVTLSFLQD